MLTVELKFKEGEKELSFERFADFLAARLALVLKEHFLTGNAAGQPAISKLASQARASLVPSQANEKTAPRAVSIDEAARLLGIRPTTLRVYAAQGRIRVVHIGCVLRTQEGSHSQGDRRGPALKDHLRGSGTKTL